MDTATIIIILTIIGTGITLAGVIKGDIREIRKTAEETKNKLTVLITELKTRNIIHLSPLGLSPTGRDKLEKSGAIAFIDKYFNELYEEFDELNTNYDIHDKAIEVAQDVYKNNDNFVPVKRYAYNEGIEDFVLMVAIEIRDRVCNKKGIKIKERAQTADVR